MRAGIVDYRMGNLASVSKALEHGGASAFVSDDVTVLGDADALVLPGVGNCASGMSNLERLGLKDFITQWSVGGKPLLGICLGMQLLFESSEEGNTKGLGVLPGKVVRFRSGLKVPHMGWNTVSGSGLLAPFDGRSFYFVHSYVCEPDPGIVTGRTDYGGEFASAIETGSIIGFQFHPEKSSTDGLALIRRWVEVMQT